ncbi:hypothetical protein [Candidatus Amarolinea dominans]|uniref:hypothetical protein n=1 Tax=Candidatus Amarolinea dominans TaxID=3140696 RepID=UPI0031370C5C|nr:hypothetical protein [Anaerolineae bacterium]
MKSRLVGVPPGVHLRGRDAGSTRRVNPAARRDAWRSDLRAVVRAAQSLLAAGLLAVGLAAIFLFPLLAEQRYIGQAVWVRNSYQVETNLIYFHQLFSTSWGFGYSVAGPDDGMSFQLGLAPLLLAVGGVGYSVRRRGQHRGLLAFFLLTTVIVAGMMLAPAAAVWQWLPLGDLIQFPWRLLTLTALALAIMGGASVRCCACTAVAIGDEAQSRLTIPATAAPMDSLGARPFLRWRYSSSSPAPLSCSHSGPPSPRATKVPWRSWTSKWSIPT